MVPSSESEFAVHEEYGVEDPRICLIGGEYYITYSAYSRFGVRIGLAKRAILRLSREYRSLARQTCAMS